MGSLNFCLGQHCVNAKAEHVNPKVSVLLSDQLVLTDFALHILPFTPVEKRPDQLKSDI